jgi:hypothetical protein
MVEEMGREEYGGSDDVMREREIPSYGDSLLP